MKLFKNLFVRPKKSKTEPGTLSEINTRSRYKQPELTLFQTKKCRKCSVEKSASCFHRHTKSKDGLQSYCKICGRKATRAAKKKILRRKKRNQLSQAGLASMALTVKEVPAEIYEKLIRLQEVKKCTQRDLFLEIISTYLTLFDVSEFEYTEVRSK